MSNYLKVDTSVRGETRHLMDWRHVDVQDIPSSVVTRSTLHMDMRRIGAVNPDLAVGQRLSEYGARSWTILVILRIPIIKPKLDICYTNACSHIPARIDNLRLSIHWLLLFSIHPHPDSDPEHKHDENQECHSLPRRRCLSFEARVAGESDLLLAQLSHIESPLLLVHTGPATIIATAAVRRPYFGLLRRRRARYIIGWETFVFGRHSESDIDKRRRRRG
jgi:hypothetical protein